MKYEVLIREEKEGYRAEVPSLPGCISVGKTREEAIAGIREQIRQASSSPASSSRVWKIEIEAGGASGGERPASPSDPILQLSGLGKEIWQGIDPDEYVRRERESWA
jgi:hypothetical protein